MWFRVDAIGLARRVNQLIRLVKLSSEVSGSATNRARTSITYDKELII